MCNHPKSEQVKTKTNAVICASCGEVLKVSDFNERDFDHWNMKKATVWDIERMWARLWGSVTPAQFHILNNDLRFPRENGELLDLTQQAEA